MNQKETILVTGANSLLGPNVISALLEKGCRVRGLLRRAGDFRLPAHPELEIIEGDFTSEECLRRAVPGCGAVIHTAAVTSQNGLHYREYHEVNVRGTRRLIESAIEHGARRFVEVGSANVFGYGSREIPGCELNEMCEPFASSYYARSKYEALKAAMSYTDRIEVVGVAPTFMLGPYDSKPSSGRIIMMSYGKRILFCPPGGKNFVHVGDVALGVAEALEKGVNGETYLLCSENLTYKEFYRLVGRVSGKRAVCLTIPRPVLYAAGCAGSFLRMLGIRSEVSLANMRMLCVTGYYHNYKASRDLGVDFRPAEDAVRDAVEWFAAEGRLRRGENRE